MDLSELRDKSLYDIRMLLSKMYKKLMEKQYGREEDKMYNFRTKEEIDSMFEDTVHLSDEYKKLSIRSRSELEHTRFVPFPTIGECTELSNKFNRFKNGEHFEFNPFEFKVDGVQLYNSTKEIPKEVDGLTDYWFMGLLVRTVLFFRVGGTLVMLKKQCGRGWVIEFIRSSLHHSLCYCGDDEIAINNLLAELNK